MSVCFVFNDASLPFASIENCEKSIPNFFLILRKAIKNEVQVIRTNNTIGNNWYKFHYADDFSLSQWVEQQKDKDYKRHIRSIMDKTECPLVSSEDFEVLSALENSDFELPGEKPKDVSSLGAAFLLKTSAVSFCSSPQWDSIVIDIVHLYLDGASSRIIREDCSADNVSQLDHLTSFLDRIKKERRDSREYLKSIKVKGNKDFPNLIFCPSTIKIFNHLEVSSFLLEKINYALDKLNSAITQANSDFDLIDMTGLNISGESDSTKQNKKLIKYRKFKLPNGEFRIFDLHVKNFPNYQRLYFLPDYDNHRIFIGYFGKHLPT